MFLVLEHIAKATTATVQRLITFYLGCIHDIWQWYDSIWVHKAPPNAPDYESYCLHLLMNSINDADNIDYDIANSALVGLRQYAWDSFPAELHEAGVINTAHNTLQEAINRVKHLSYCAKLTVTELHPYRGNVEVPVLEWICPKGRGWSHTAVVSNLNTYATRIRELCTTMNVLTKQGAINEVQRNNWWVINRALCIALNTMLQLYTKL